MPPEKNLSRLENAVSGYICIWLLLRIICLQMAYGRMILHVLSLHYTADYLILGAFAKF
jgi:hypothetical protein